MRSRLGRLPNCPGGLEGALDPILDLAVGPLSVSEAAAKEEAFARASAGDGVTFAIVA